MYTHGGGDYIAAADVNFERIPNAPVALSLLFFLLRNGRTLETSQSRGAEVENPITYPLDCPNWLMQACGFFIIIIKIRMLKLSS